MQTDTGHIQYTHTYVAYTNVRLVGFELATLNRILCTLHTDTQQTAQLNITSFEITKGPSEANKMAKFIKYAEIKLI